MVVSERECPPSKSLIVPSGEALLNLRWRGIKGDSNRSSMMGIAPVHVQSVNVTLRREEIIWVDFGYQIPPPVTAKTDYRSVLSYETSSLFNLLVPGIYVGLLMICFQTHRLESLPSLMKQKMTEMKYRSDSSTIRYVPWVCWILRLSAQAFFLFKYC